MEGYGGRIQSIIINSLNLFRVESFGMDSKSSVLILSFTLSHCGGFHIHLTWTLLKSLPQIVP